MMAARGWFLVVLLTVPSLAHAGELWQLPVGSSPRSLHMRASAWQLAVSDAEEEEAALGGAAEAEAQSENADYGKRGIDRLERRQLEADVLAPPSPLSDKVIFRFNLGMGLDSGLPSNRPTLSGNMLGATDEFDRRRIYSFADTVAGTKGLGFPGVSTYFAANFRFNHTNIQNSSPLPSVFDGQSRRTLIRSAYGESNGYFKSPLLRPIYFRAGRSYHYDLAVIHYQGGKVGYDTPALKLSAMVGEQRNLHGVDNEDLVGGSLVFAASTRVDFFEWRGWPVVAFGSWLKFNDRNHTRSGIALRWNRNVLLSSSFRRLDAKLARSDFSLRARISDVTTINVQLNNRRRADWSFGHLQIRTPNNVDDDRRYLDLGPVLPRSVLSVRYGTVFMRNLDLLLRAGGAYDRRDRDTIASSFSASYAEVGGAAEVRVRRSLRIGTSASTRRYFIGNNKTPMLVPGQADALPDQLGSTGTTSFWQGGMAMHYSPGARQFSGSAEFYARRYSLRSEAISDTTAILRSGGRFSVEGWVMDRVRLKVEYDLTFGNLVMAPELRDLKSLRVLMEGSF